MDLDTAPGDDGTTGLLDGARVGKDDLRTEAYGTVDEAVSALGVARAGLDGEWADAVLGVQRELFVVGAQLATSSDRWPELTDGVSRATPAMLDRLEDAIVRLTERFPPPQEFVVPGERAPGAALDLARAITRRAERAVVRMGHAGLLPDDLPLRYLNRLSDYLFALARAVEGGEYVPSREHD
jgi:cob(I)alamin adenosyltransferase